MLGFLGKFFDNNEKEVKRLQMLVSQVGSYEDGMRKLKDPAFAKKTVELKNKIAEGSTLDELLPEAFALVREAARRTLDMRHFDVQLIAAAALHKGKVAEQKTGEGKTLSASPAIYLNALTGRGVHLVTVNDYLARRDAGWMAPIYHLLGLSVSAIISDQSFIYDPNFVDETAVDWRLRHLKPISRPEAYRADITYGVNSEFGFDYLRDNMVSEPERMSQREFHYAIVDEVDSVLIDEARTPHIISAPDTEPTSRYSEIARIVEKLSKDTDFNIDEKLRIVHLTDHGIVKVEKMLGLGNIYETSFETVHLIEAALKARALFHREKQYIVKDGQVIIVDEFTGRLLNGRRFSEGIHQAIEAKEGVQIQQESKTLATVSLQNYFRMYEKLAGMTGTAATEAEEFHKIYKLDVVIIPTHRKMVRSDFTDSVYKTPRAKYAAIVQEIIDIHKTGRPVLVGTTSIDKNEIISEYLRRRGVPHNVLNAKNHLQEAMIISDAGKKGAVTVATNMAGRGVDIILGGAKREAWEFEKPSDFEKEMLGWQSHHDEVIELGGLHVIGTERHESRRIDNQLRGRAGRQGDPGSTRFFVSLEDEIMRLFGGEQVAKLMSAFNLPEDVPLEHPMVSRAIEQAQIKVEGFHFDSRKHLVEYDDVLNKQREIVYGRRKSALLMESQKEKILEKIAREVQMIVVSHVDEKDNLMDYEAIAQALGGIIPFDPASLEQLKKQLMQLHSTDEATEFLTKLTRDLYEAREKQDGPELMRQIERWVTLSVIDNLWMDHLDAIDDLREGIGLRGYGQRDPLVEYKNEAFSMFERLTAGIDTEIVNRIYKIQVSVSGQNTRDQLPGTGDQGKQIQNSRLRQGSGGQAELKSQNSKNKHGSSTKGLVLPQSPKRKMVTNDSNAPKKSEQVVVEIKLGRNDPCPCGSGKKWKKCHYPQMP